MAGSFIQGNFLKSLRDKILLGTTARILTGTDDPTSVAQNGEQGSLYLRVGASGGTLFVKQDVGSTTNWTVLGASAAATFETVFYSQHAGQGSTNTAIPHFTNTQTDTSGTLITVANSTTNGFSITAALACTVTMTLSGNTTTAKSVGISLNSVSLTTSILAIAQSERLAESHTGSAGNVSGCTARVRLAVNDVLRPHTELSPQSNNRWNIIILAES